MAALLIVAYVAFIILFAIGVCWLWPDFVDCSDPPRIRTALLVVLFLENSCELAVCFSGAVKPWTVLVVLLCNCWGMLDAFLRYPIVHDLDSLFSLKQVLLVTVKLAGYALGFRNVAKRVGWFILLVLCCVFLVPILWLTALPIGDVSSYHQKHDAVDMDIAVRFYRMICMPAERQAALARCKVGMKRFVVLLARIMPCIRTLVVRWDPTLARMLRSAPAV